MSEADEIGRVRRWQGRARPIRQLDPQQAARGAGPEAAGEMLCELRNDARRLTKQMQDAQRQNAESLLALSEIRDILRSQTEDAENMMAQADANTAAIVGAVEGVVAAMARLCDTLTRDRTDDSR